MMFLIVTGTIGLCAVAVGRSLETPEGRQNAHDKLSALNDWLNKKS